MDLPAVEGQAKHAVALRGNGQRRETLRQRGAGLDLNPRQIVEAALLEVGAPADAIARPSLLARQGQLLHQARPERGNDLLVVRLDAGGQAGDGEGLAAGDAVEQCEIGLCSSESGHLFLHDGLRLRDVPFEASGRDIEDLLEASGKGFLGFESAVEGELRQGRRPVAQEACCGVEHPLPAHMAHDALADLGREEPGEMEGGQAGNSGQPADAQGLEEIRLDMPDHMLEALAAAHRMPPPSLSCLEGWRISPDLS